MSDTRDIGKLSAWERWELADFDAPEGKPKASQKQDAPPPEPELQLPTAEEIERIHQEAHQQGHEAGYAEGLAKGRAEGYAEGQAAARAEAERLGNAAAKLEAAMAGLDAGVADELLALSLEVARQVLRGEVSAHPETILNVVREALAQLPHQHAAIYLHPEDASLVRSYLGDQLSHGGNRVLEDTNLARGDCRLEAGGTHLDAGMETRWRRVLENLGMEGAWKAPVEDA